MDNQDVRVIDKALRDEGGATAEALASSCSKPLGVVQAALDRLVRDRLARRNGTEAGSGRALYVPLPAGRRF